MAPVVLLASWLTSRQSYPDKIIIMVSISCSLLMVLFCSMEDPYAHYKVSFTDGAFGFMMCASLSFFTVHGKKYLPKVGLFCDFAISNICRMRGHVVFEFTNSS